MALTGVFDLIRIDGDPSFPFCFMTIEDGGRPYETKTELMEDINRSGLCRGNFTKGKESEPGELGVPGKKIAKLMTCFKSGSNAINQWREYSRDVLYKEYEFNLKFYPLARNSQSLWTKNYESWTGMTRGEYMEFCSLDRPDVIYSNKEIKKHLNVEKHYIITSVKWEWFQFIKKIFPDEIMDYRKSSTKNVGRFVDKMGREMYSFYFKKDGRLAYAYFPIFRRPLPDDYIQKFAERYMKLAEKSKVNVFS